MSASKKGGGEAGPGHKPQTVDDSYRLLVENITDYAIYMLDPNGIVSNWNLGAQRFKAISRKRSSGSISASSSPRKTRLRACRSAS